MQHMIIIIIAATNTTTFFCFLNASFIVSESPYIFYKCIVTYTYFLDRRSHTKNTTLLVLKIPKTESSVRKVFLPRSVAEMLQKWKLKQLNTKAILGEEYNDYNLVMTSEFGSPLESGTIRVSFNKLIEEHHLPKVVFHSLRHSSVTYKLKLNKGDIKAVQGDSGHSQTDMVTDVYSHIIDEDRKKNAELFEDAFYKKNNLDPNMVSEEVDMELLMKALANPEMRALLNSLAKTMK